MTAITRIGALLVLVAGLVRAVIILRRSVRVVESEIEEWDRAFQMQRIRARETER